MFQEDPDMARAKANMSAFTLSGMSWPWKWAQGSPRLCSEMSRLSPKALGLPWHLTSGSQIFSQHPLDRFPFLKILLSPPRGSLGDGLLTFDNDKSLYTRQKLELKCRFATWFHSNARKA